MADAALQERAWLVSFCVIDMPVGDPEGEQPPNHMLLAIPLITPYKSLIRI